MKKAQDYRPLGCVNCAKNAGLDFNFTMAFQPIVDATSREIFAYEALVRGSNNEPAGQVFAHVNDENRYQFDQNCRVKAIQLAADLKISSFLSINFMPNAVYQPESCIRTTLEAADIFGFSINQIIFEIVESEQVDDLDHLRNIVDYYKQSGFKTAIDDFGAGYAGLNFLSNIHADILKLDMALIRNIHQDRTRQIIVRGILQICKELSVKVIAEGIEVREEFSILQDFGVELFQGYYFAKPGFQSLPVVAPGAFDRP